MSYIVPIHHASGVRHALKLNFLDKDVDTLVVACVFDLPRFDVQTLRCNLGKQIACTFMNRVRKACHYCTLKTSLAISRYSKALGLRRPKQITSSSALIDTNTLHVLGMPVSSSCRPSKAMLTWLIKSSGTLERWIDVTSIRRDGS